jgi:ribosome-associated heat shock protein Hsp15
MGQATRENVIDAVRLDRWLWAARMFRSRSLAANACDEGKVHVNDATAKPHKHLRVGDRLSITGERAVRELRVQALSERRGPAESARQLYEDLTPPPPPRPLREPPPVVRDQGSGRPTKRDRRQLNRLRW